MIATGIAYGLDHAMLNLSQPADINITAFEDVTEPRFIWTGNLDSAVRAMLTVSDGIMTFVAIFREKEETSLLFLA